MISLLEWQTNARTARTSMLLMLIKNRQVRILCLSTLWASQVRTAVIICSPLLLNSYITHLSVSHISMMYKLVSCRHTVNNWWLVLRATAQSISRGRSPREIGCALHEVPVISCFITWCTTSQRVTRARRTCALPKSTLPWDCWPGGLAKPWDCWPVGAWLHNRP